MDVIVGVREGTGVGEGPSKVGVAVAVGSRVGVAISVCWAGTNTASSGGLKK